MTNKPLSGKMAAGIVLLQLELVSFRKESGMTLPEMCEMLGAGNIEAREICESLMAAKPEDVEIWFRDLIDFEIVGSAMVQLFDNCHRKIEWLVALIIGLQFGDVEKSDLQILAILNYPLTPDFFCDIERRNKEWRSVAA